VNDEQKYQKFDFGSIHQGRIASLQRACAMFVMFHELGKRVQDFWPAWTGGYLGYDMSRTHSIMRIATTASPVSGAEVRDRTLELAQKTKMKGALAIIGRLVARARERDYIKWLMQTKGQRPTRQSVNKRLRDLPSPIRGPIPSPLRPSSPIVGRVSGADAREVPAVQAPGPAAMYGQGAAQNGNGTNGKGSQYSKITKLDPLTQSVKPLNGCTDVSMEMPEPAATGVLMKPSALPPLTIAGKCAESSVVRRFCVLTPQSSTLPFTQPSLNPHLARRPYSQGSAAFISYPGHTGTS
jgi:hypothetical protein